MRKWADYPVPQSERRHDVPATLKVVPGLWSPQLRNRRDLVVYLPPSYEREPDRRYPVLYMHDGQNVFDPHTSFAGHWQAGAALAHHAGKGLELIVVAIPNMGTRRLYEYTPHRDVIRGGGGGDRYLGFLVETVKPLIDRKLRTERGPECTALAGSSLGGLISLYALLRSPWTFGAAGVISPALWFADGRIFDVVREAEPVEGGRIHLDIGTHEGPDALEDTRQMRDLLRQVGFVPGETLSYYEDAGARHTERAWARRFRKVLPFLFGGPVPEAGRPSGVFRVVRDEGPASPVAGPAAEPGHEAHPMRRDDDAPLPRAIRGDGTSG
ncbi:MAG: alpha/beta hydrolase [Gemmatimonadetes bacterium]|nr:alpha/beta hydrolase [Gemmatimonadota bacterium]